MTTAALIRAAMRGLTEPATVAEIRAIEPATTISAIAGMVRKGVIEAIGEQRHYRYRLIRDTRVYGRTPEEKAAALARKNARAKERMRAKRAAAPKPVRAVKPKPARPVREVKWSVPIAPSGRQPKAEQPPETVEQWMARTGKKPQRLGPYDISTPFRHIGKAA